ncbi:GlxA family transcriptional regulator [Streptomyces sp. NPDC020965]|uniref:GlxA family transcriptional regulator n=1 Tax=Streptomyces sp. NPDC020965 TaxID=3365105 RepID=UPI0037B88C7C
MSVIAVLALHGVPGYQLTNPGMVFGTAGHHYAPATYEVRICTGPGRGTDPGPGPERGAGPGPGPGRGAGPGVGGTAGPGPFRIDTPWGTEGLADADIVLLTGHDGFRDEPSAEVVEAVRDAAARGCRIGAVGTGTFTLAATGLLDGRRATTCGEHLGELAVRHPRIDIDPVGAVVRDGSLLTTAGVFGGVDLCLEIITQDHGNPVAVETERQLFLLLHAQSDTLRSDALRNDPLRAAPLRTGGTEGSITRDGLEPTLRWLAGNLHRPLTLADIAAHAGISVSSLNRRFRARTGLPPLQFVLRARVQEAQRLLERGDDSVERVAARTGFGTPTNLRHQFQRSTGTTPTAYRTAFRALVDRLTLAPDDRRDTPDPALDPTTDAATTARSRPTDEVGRPTSPRARA